MTPLRIAVLGNFQTWYSYFLYGMMEGAVRNGAWFRPITLHQPSEEIYGAMVYFRPHILLCHMIFNYDYGPEPGYPDRLLDYLRKARRKLGVKVFYQFGDPKGQPRKAEDISQWVDVGLINNSLIEKFSSIWGVPCYRFPYFCLYQEGLAQVREEFKSDITFTGNWTKRESPHVHTGRQEFLMELSNHVLLSVWPDGDINTRFLTPEVSASSKAVIGIHQAWEVEGYLDTRPFQYIGSGALYFHDKCPAMQEFFVDGRHYVSYEPRNIESLLEKYRYFVVDHPEEGEKIKQQGFEFCQQTFSTKARVRQVIDIFEGRS